MSYLRTQAVRTLTVAAVAVAASVAPSAAQALPTPQQVVARYVAAIGGEQAITRQQQRHAQLEVAIPAAGLTMTGELYQARPNKMVMRAEIPGMGSIQQGFDGQVAWSINPMQGPRVITGQELAETLRQVDFDSNLRFAASMFPTMETVGRDTVNGDACVQVRMVATGGTEMVNCFADDDGLLVGSTIKTSTEAGPMESTVVYEEYRELSGIKMPTRTTMNLMGQQMVTTIKSLTTEPFDPAVFALPAEIKALQQ